MKIASIWVTLDTKNTLQEIVDYWESQIGDLLFLAEENSTAFDNNAFFQTANEPLQNSKPVELKMVGDAEVLDWNYGLKLLSPPLLINQFQQAEFLDEESANAANELCWLNAFPLSLNIVRNVIYEKPYASMTFNMSLGTFGARHLELAALAEILREDLRTQGPSPQMEQMAVATELASQKLKAWEASIDFSSVVEKIWTAALATATAMGPKGELSILSVDSEGSSPADLTLGRPTRHIPKIYRPDPMSFVVEAWTTRLEYGGLESDRAVRYFSTRKDTDLWKQVYKNCMRARKGTWPAVVEILSQDPVTEENLDSLLGFLADINWPGAFEAWTYILSRKEKAIPAIDASIARAKAGNDTWWLESLQTIREMVSAEQKL